MHAALSFVERAPRKSWQGTLAGRGIVSTAYDTAWLASVPAPDDATRPRYPLALEWLLDNQLSDGSWGGAIRYEHDRVVSTLAAVTALALFPRPGHYQAIDAGTRYLWQHSHLLRNEPMEPVGFELLLPALVKRGEDAGILVPPFLASLYQAQREEKLKLIPPAYLYSSRTTAVHSLEFLGDQVNREALANAQGANGSVGNSPAATAYFLTQHGDDPRAAAYLEGCLARDGGVSVPVLHPCETYELLWSAYHLHLAGIPARRLLSADDRAFLKAALAQGGISLSPSFPIPDADDTAVAVLLLADAGEAVDPSVLKSFALPSGHFASFPHERHSSVGVNLHVLHALLDVPGYPDAEQVIDGLLDYLEQHQVDGLYWLDKWHVSPYYATSHALRVFEALRDPAHRARVAPMAERARAWLRQTQREDGAWGWFDDQATVEETAYGVLALANEPDDAARVAAGLRYLRAWRATQERSHGPADSGAGLPPLWIDKCLYTPVLVVRSVIEAALLVTPFPADGGSTAPPIPLPVGRRAGLGRRAAPGRKAADVRPSHGGIPTGGTRAIYA